MALVSKKIKKLAKVGSGLGVILIEEAKQLHWTNDDYLHVEIHQDGKQDYILLKRVRN